jgi:uncharacterized integral membrane protein (TIGR00698 family)
MPASIELRSASITIRPVQIVFLMVAAACALPWISPPAALALGLCLGIAGANPWPSQTTSLSKSMLRICIVGLGFGVQLHTVLVAGRASFGYTALGIVIVMSVGMALGRLLRVPRNISLLLAAGTSICGGSAIAAVSPVLNADDEESAISLAAVFVLNAIALFIFPSIGLWARLSQTQFGLWAALAIHDTSSVVGAGLKYGPVALSVATTVKLVRTIWIVPLTFGIAIVVKSRARIAWPWFILLFLAAAVVRQLFPSGFQVWDFLASASRTGFSIVLFLIGAGLSTKALRRLGWRTLVAATSLWLLVSIVTLFFIKEKWIAL